MTIKKRFARGFTLIELMMVIAVIAIISAIAYPSYQIQVRKGKRAEGRTALLKAAQYQERYFTTNSTYADSTAFPTLFGLAASATVYSADGTGPNNNANSNYVISVAAGQTGTLASSFTVTATPQFVDALCGTLSITNTGLKSSGSGSVSDCW